MKTTRTVLLLSAALALAWSTSFSQQSQNPLEILKEALKKALPQNTGAAPAVPPTSQASVPPGREPTAAGATAEPFSIEEPKSAPSAAALGDFKALPDIVGIHLGMPLNEALSALQARYNGRVKPTLPMQSYPGYTKPALLEFSVGWNIPGVNDETVLVEVTAPPQKQVVWAVHRSLGDANHKMLRKDVLAALHQKYGRETLGLQQNSNEVARSIDESAVLWWLFDERGKPVALPAMGVVAVAACADLFEVSQLTVRGFDVAAAADLKMRHDSCTSSLVIVRARVDPTEVIYGFTVEAVEVPVAARALRATVALLNGAARQEQQSEIQKASENKPSL